MEEGKPSRSQKFTIFLIFRVYYYFELWGWCQNRKPDDDISVKQIGKYENTGKQHLARCYWLPLDRTSGASEFVARPPRSVRGNSTRREGVWGRRIRHPQAVDRMVGGPSMIVLIETYAPYMYM